MIRIQFSPKSPAALDTVIVPLNEGGKPVCTVFPELADLIAHLQQAADFKQKPGTTHVHILPPKSFAKKLVLLCIGKLDAPSLSYEETGGKLAETLLAHKITSAHMWMDAAGTQTGSIAAAVVNGVQLRQYRFDTYRTKNRDSLPKGLDSLTVVCGDHAAHAAQAYQSFEDVTHGVHLARNLVSMPPNDLTPMVYAKHVQDIAKQAGLSCTVFDKKALQKMGMGSFVAVGQGSENDPCMVILEYTPAGKKTERPVALVGKGITFDSGGLSLKPAASMPEMKADMAGSAAVLGTMVACARMQLGVRVVAALALAENLPSDDAYRPGDVLKTLSGQTVEVLNTDAEGRLVLCDTMTYVQQQYKPKVMVDIATLTGAIIVALGDVYAGAFTPHDGLHTELQQAALTSGELLWRMPIHADFDADIKSDIADMKNIGSPGKAGSATAAAFLHRFVEGDTQWVHLDMASTMLYAKDKPLYPKGASGWGVRLLSHWLRVRSGA